MVTLLHNRWAARPSATVSPIVINTSSLPNGTVGTAYSASLSASGGVGPYTWSFLSNTPNTGSWLSLSSGGIFSGTPTTAETESIAVLARDAVGNTASAVFSLVVATGLTDLTKIFRFIDYDGRTNGSSPSDTGLAYHDSAVIDNVNTWNGHLSVKHTLAGPAGSNGPFGDESDFTIFPVNPQLQAGDELWVARTLYVASSFDYSAGGNLKWLRLANLRHDVSTNNGWLDFYITSTTGTMKHQNELVALAQDFSSQADATLAARNYQFPKGTWVVFQGYAKFDNTQGIVRAWADNTPIYENLASLTSVSGATVFYTYWQNFWNNGLPAGNIGINMWSSRLAIAVKSAALGRDDRSFLATDSRGNLYIKMV